MVANKNIVCVNWHVTEVCNYRCRYCFATFSGVRAIPRLSTKDSLRVIEAIAKTQCTKITFAGGEPLLHPDIILLIKHAKSLGLTTMLVTNGHYWNRKIAYKVSGSLDWAALSLDASVMETQALLGRGNFDPFERAASFSDLARDIGIRFKLNTVVTKVNLYDDLSKLVRRSRPERWKIFQYLPVSGERFDPALTVTREEFKSFVERHNHLKGEGFKMVPEDNFAMSGSYVMLDPRGRPYDHRLDPMGGPGKRRYYPSVIDVGLKDSISNINYEFSKLRSRSGMYNWT